MARIALATVCVTALVAFAAAEVSVIGPKDLYNPASSTSISLISPNEKGQQTMVEGAEELEALGPAVTDVHLSRYADPIWDKQYFGSNVYWMGLGHGGCGYGNLLDPNKYPYMFGLSLSDGARKALGFDATDGVGCGGCVRATCVDEYKPYCPLGNTSAVGVVLDVCPDIPGHSSGKQCHDLQADMYIKAWEFATGKSPSNPKVKLQRVMCPDPQSNIFAMIMSNKGPWQFLKLNLQNVGGTGIVANVSLTCKDKADKNEKTVDLLNSYGAVWQANNQPQYVDKCKMTLWSEGRKTKVETDWFDKLPVKTMEDYPFAAILDLGVQFDSGFDGAAPAPAPAVRPVAADKSSTSSSISRGFTLAGRRLVEA